jgi:hypothetical protein
MIARPRPVVVPCVTGRLNSQLTGGSARSGAIHGHPTTGMLRATAPNAGAPAGGGAVRPGSLPRCTRGQPR